MKEAFEKIIDKLHNIGGCDATCNFDEGWDDAIDEAISIVQGVAKEYNNGWISCSGCKDCKNKECEHYGKV